MDSQEYNNDSSPSTMGNSTPSSTACYSSSGLDLVNGFGSPGPAFYLDPSLYLRGNNLDPINLLNFSLDYSINPVEDASIPNFSLTNYTGVGPSPQSETYATNSLELTLNTQPDFVIGTSLDTFSSFDTPFAHPAQKIEGNGLDTTTENHTNRKTSKRVVCEYEGCNISFGREYDRKRHVQNIHVSPGSFRCTVAGCTKVFNQKYNLTAHLKSKIHQTP